MAEVSVDGEEVVFEGEAPQDVGQVFELLLGAMSERGRALTNLLGTLLFLIPFCGLMLWVSWPAAVRSWQIREVSPDPGGLPRWPIKALLLVSFALLLLQGLALLVRQVGVLRHGGHGDEHGAASGEGGSRHGEWL